MSHPDGRASLASRERYLRRRHALHGDRAGVALWVFLGTLVTWLSIAGFAGLSAH